MKSFRITVLLLAFAGAIGGLSWSLYYGGRTIHDLLNENEKLKEAITRLTDEDAIGFAKVTDQRPGPDGVYTTLKFVEVDRADQTKILLERTYTVPGDVVHFDLLIIRFTNQMVKDGRERSIYIWRRIYGEDQPPSEGQPIEREGAIPERYKHLTENLSEHDRKLFWDAIWDLAHNKDYLSKNGITAIHGNVVYTQLREGLIYTFSISNTGQVTPNTIPDL